MIAIMNLRSGHTDIKIIIGSEKPIMSNILLQEDKIALYILVEYKSFFSFAAREGE